MTGSLNKTVMTNTEFKTNYKVEVIKYRKFNDLNDKVHYFMFLVRGNGFEDYYHINCDSMVAEPEFGRHIHSYQIGTHLRNVADEILEILK